jgi:CMP-N-acetylneuraminic acid synthetase
LRKNLYPLNDIPLIAYTIKAAQASRLDDFIVTTDDEEIAAYSESLGCKAVREPAMGQGEPGAIVRSVQWAVETYELHKRLNGKTVHVDAVCLLQPTSPLRQHTDIDKALGMFNNPIPWIAPANPQYFDSVVSVYWGIHPLKSYLVEEGCRPVPFLPQTPYDKHIHRCLTRNGAVFMARRALLDEGKLWGGEIAYLPMDKQYSIDIDDLQDLAIAEALLKAGVV